MNKIEELIENWTTNEIINGVEYSIVIERELIKRFKLDIKSIIQQAVEEERDKYKTNLTAIKASLHLLNIPIKKREVIERELESAIRSKQCINTL